MAREVPARLTPAAGRRFAFTLGGALFVFAALFVWRGRHTAAWVFASLGVILSLAGIAAPTHLGPVERTWTRLSLAISKVTTPIIVGVLYFVILTPVALIARLVGHNELTRSRNTADSLWVRRPAGERRGDLERQF